jgi:demethylmenaquinone methyltransferase/2-methoxy-6-polyprenyl-1,4-benzoquinol methylase
MSAARACPAAARDEYYQAMQATGESQTGPALAPHPVLGRFYERPEERPAILGGLFDDSARYYDRITTLLSGGTGARYRREVLERIGVGPGARVLDVACGTGQVSQAAARLVGPEGLVLGVDPSEGMRRVAESRRALRTVAGTAENLPVEDGTFDFVVMGYALRHVSDLVAAFREMRRVLRPGGTVAILEITTPEGRLHRWALKFYFKRLAPPATLLLTGSRRAVQLMHYYWDSIEQCVSPPLILEAMARAGLENPVRQRTLQIFNEYVAKAP